MRRFWFLLLAIAMTLVIALPAGAGKPTKPKPPSSAPVAATLNAQPIWVHEDGDVIWYSVTVQNKTQSPITATILHPGGPTEVSITEPRGVAEFPNLFSYPVTEDDVLAAIDIVRTVVVTYEGGEVVAETSTVMDPVDECVFEDEDENPVVTKSGLCIWKPAPGIWDLSAVPDPDQMPTKRPTNVMMTMRDGVPGNWCTLSTDGGGGVVQERWLPNSPTPIVLDVNLPSDGMCLMGGAGVCTDDDCYFAVGNPESFYLYTTFDATITLTKH